MKFFLCYFFIFDNFLFNVVTLERYCQIWTSPSDDWWANEGKLRAETILPVTYLLIWTICNENRDNVNAIQFATNLLSVLYINQDLNAILFIKRHITIHPFFIFLNFFWYWHNIWFIKHDNSIFGRRWADSFRNFNFGLLLFWFYFPKLFLVLLFNWKINCINLKFNVDYCRNMIFWLFWNLPCTCC